MMLHAFRLELPLRPKFGGPRRFVAPDPFTNVLTDSVVLAELCPDQWPGHGAAAVGSTVTGPGPGRSAKPPAHALAAHMAGAGGGDRAPTAGFCGAGSGDGGSGGGGQRGTEGGGLERRVVSKHWDAAKIREMDRVAKEGDDVAAAEIARELAAMGVRLLGPAGHAPRYQWA